MGIALLYPWLNKCIGGLMWMQADVIGSTGTPRTQTI
jgi:hypothetical protein